MPLEDHMRNAIRSASAAWPHPNPRVGAVAIAPNGAVVGSGVHRRAGEPHAEVEALVAAGPKAAGGTLVVTLEPCNHFGRTPPCTEAIIDSGVARVVIGAIDPDARVAGQGCERLRAAGLDVQVGLLEEEVEQMDPGYFHHRRTGRPRVTLKAAMTLDGQIAAADGSSQWITSEEARTDGHRLRAQADAVIVGAGTALHDDPALTVRLPAYDGRQPLPVVIAGTRSIPDNLKVFDRDAIVIATEDVDVPSTVVVAGRPGRVDLEEALRALGDRGHLDVLVEGGASLARNLLDAGLVDRGVFYYGSRLAGGAGLPAFAGTFGTLADAYEVQIISVNQLGDNVRVEFALENRD